MVTVPHKQAFAALVDTLTDRATALGAVNVVRRMPDGKLTGDMIDGLGFINAARQHGFKPAGRHALVVGAGGAGSAIAYALCEAGIARLSLLDTDAARLDKLAKGLRSHFASVAISLECESVRGFDLLVNATPIGMKADPILPLSPTLLQHLEAGCHVCDVVTSPDVTPFLSFAQAKGCSIQTGAEMARAQMEYLGSFLGVMPATN